MSERVIEAVQLKEAEMKELAEVLESYGLTHMDSILAAEAVADLGWTKL